MDQHQHEPWTTWPHAEALIQEYLDQFLACHTPARRLGADMERFTSTRMFDWLDHLILRGDRRLVSRLRAAGFVPEAAETAAGITLFRHPGAQLPRLALRIGSHKPEVLGIAIKVDSIADFLLAHGVQASASGSVLSPYRVAKLWPEGERAVLAVERRGYRGLVPQRQPMIYAARYLAARERWATRPRKFEDAGGGLARTLELARELVREVGPDIAAWIVFEVERDYWQRRNWAGQLQKARQDRLGLGWGNHDHHTFRSSRTAFRTLVALMETLGFVCRERYYAGDEAGWGAQIIEQSHCGLVAFLDADLLPKETAVDFAHDALPESDRLGTVGLWCALHDESILGAGIHHLEAQFDFDRLREDLAAMGIDTMKPFSDSHHLRQAFTRGERWAVGPVRIERLRANGRITEEQAQTFLTSGAIGSHLENLQRREGYKGFNRHNVGSIIEGDRPPPSDRRVNASAREPSLPAEGAPPSGQSGRIVLHVNG